MSVSDINLDIVVQLQVQKCILEEVRPITDSLLKRRCIYSITITAAHLLLT